jgi:hypothetical protein
MTFEEVLDQAMAMLQRRGRVTYRTLQRQFQLDEAALDDLKDALLYAHPQIHDVPGAVSSGRVTQAPLRALRRCQRRHPSGHHSPTPHPISMFAMDGVMESAYVVERPEHYLSHPAFAYIGSLSEVMA